MQSLNCETKALRCAQCNAIHRSITEQFKTAIVYGKSVKHQPQRVGLSHELADEDIGTYLERAESRALVALALGCSRVSFRLLALLLILLPPQSQLSNDDEPSRDAHHIVPTDTVNAGYLFQEESRWEARDRYSMIKIG